MVKIMLKSSTSLMPIAFPSSSLLYVLLSVIEKGDNYLKIIIFVQIYIMLFNYFIRKK
jgi:hypothetical protein